MLTSLRCCHLTAWGGWLGCLLALGISAAQAQTTTGQNPDLLPPRFIPKSPTVTTLPRFDSQQLVNLPTGGAQLSIPLFELGAGAVSLGLSLAYSYSGLQVYQPRDLVGLGWQLQAGSSITRQVNGLLDETNAFDLNRRYHPDSLQAGLSKPRYLKRAAENNVDTGPDLYSFSLPTGLSGRFIIRDTTVVLLPQQPVRVRRILGATYGRGFQIATEEGVRYQFQAVEVTTPNPNNFGSISQHASAWQLTRVISADNVDTLRLYYSSSGSETLPRQCSVTTGRYYAGQFEECGNMSSGNPGSSCGARGTYTFHNVQMHASRVKAWYLDSLTTRGARVLLARRDTTHEVRQVRLLSTVGARREIKRFSLYHSRFDGGTATDYRLRLDSLREQANGLALPAYRFTYSQPNLSPTRGSAALDYWGYANGAIANGDFTTLATPTLLADPRLTQGAQRAANRKPDFNYASIGALTQVRFPTGGSSSWDYEANLLSDSGVGVVNDTLITYLNPIGYDPAKAQVISSKSVTASDTIVFRLKRAGRVRVYLTRKPAEHFSNGGSNTYPDFNLWAKRPTGDSLITVNGSTYRSVDPAFGRNFSFQLPAGNYVAQVYCESREDSTGLTIYIPFTDSARVQPAIPGPGIRVAKTTTWALGAPPLVRTYGYTWNGVSSGQSLLPADGIGFDSYQSRSTTSKDYRGVSVCEQCYFENTSSDNRGLGNEFNKYDFYYTAVTEQLGNDQGITVHTFAHLPNQFNDVKATGQLVYRQGRGTPGRPQLAQTTTYTYFNDSVRTFPLVRVRITDTYQGTGNQTLYEPTSYELQAGFVAPTLTEQVRYDEHGRADTSRTRSYYARQRVIRTSTRTNTGWKIQRFKRLGDYAPIPAVTALQVNNFNPLIETQTWFRPLGRSDSVLTGGQVTLYAPQWRAPASVYQLRLDQPQPGPNQETLVNGKYARFQSDSRYERQATVRYAASTGDVVQQQAEHGRPTSYLTGYAHTLLIAEAKNAAYAQLAYTSFEPASTGRWQYDSTGTRQVLGGRTGRWAYRLDGGGQVSRPQLPAGDYELTYWAQGPISPHLVLGGGNQLGSGAVLLATAPDDWRQYRVQLHFTALGTVTLQTPGGNGVLLDEVRLCPIGAQLTSYTHDPLVGLTSQTGPNGRTQTYEYDGLGRLVRTRDEQGRILGQQQYHYAGQ